MKPSIYITFLLFANVLFLLSCTATQNEVSDTTDTREEISSEEIVISNEQFKSSEFTLGHIEQR